MTVATTMDSAPVIATTGLVKRFRDVEAVAGIDLQVPRGGVYGFLGPNGAGKTTTIRILLALMRPSRGSVQVLGEPARPGSPAFLRVGALVERPAFYPYLSAVDNLRVFGLMSGMSEARLATAIPEVLDRVGMTAAARRSTGRFSTGMRQRLGIAVALLRQPELVILDEPTNGLDPNGVVDVRQLIAGLAHDGLTVFLSSHVLTEVEQLCQRVAILREGRIIAEGETQAMLRQGERLFARFESADEAARALPVAASLGEATLDGDPPTRLLVDAPDGSGPELSKRLAAVGLYPAELGIRRQSLEHVFIELTHDDPAAGAAGGTAA